MRRLILVIVVGVAAALAVGGDWWRSNGGDALRGAGNVVTEPREVGGFSRIELGGSGTLHITQGETETLTVRTDDNILPLIETEVRDETLRIRVDDGDHPDGINPSELSYDLGVKSLTRIRITGAATVDAGSLVTDELRVEVTGSAQIALDGLQVTHLRVVDTGGSGFAFSGTVDTQEIIINGSGDYQAKRLTSRTATVTVNGAGHVAIQVSEALNVAIGGVGGVEYLGNPNVVQDIAGVGVVR